MFVREEIERKIAAMPEGAIFSRADFAAFGGTHAVGMALLRLEACRRVKKVARGFYAAKNGLSGGGNDLADRVEAFVRAYGQKNGCRCLAVQTIRLGEDGSFGSSAAGEGTISETKLFWTDGRGGVFRVNDQTIRLQKRSQKYLSIESSFVAGLVELFDERVEAAGHERFLEQLGEKITGNERMEIQKALPFLPVRLQNVFRFL